MHYERIAIVVFEDNRTTRLFPRTNACRWKRAKTDSGQTKQDSKSIEMESRIQNLVDFPPTPTSNLERMNEGHHRRWPTMKAGDDELPSAITYHLASSASSDISSTIQRRSSFSSSGVIRNDSKCSCRQN